MGLLDRLWGHAGADRESEDPVHDYRNALLASQPPVLGAGHTQAFEGLEEASRAELRRRLDARLSAPMGPGDASPPALAADVTQLQATGAHAVLDLLTAAPTGEGATSLPVEQIATGFLDSHAFRAQEGKLRGRRRVSHERADAEAYAQSYLIYMKDVGPTGSGPYG